MNRRYIAERINQLCEQKHMTQYELAIKSGMTQSSISNLMNRGSLPRIDTLEKICCGFGITLAQFFSPEDSGQNFSSEQREILIEWETLSPKEKEVAKSILSNIKELR